MTEKRRRFSHEFKREAVRRAYSGEQTVAEVARELDLRPEMLRRWRQHFERGGSGASGQAGLEVVQLRRRLREVEEERDILKKALAIFSDRRR